MERCSSFSSLLPISNLNVDSIRVDVIVHPILIISLRISVFVYNRLLVGEGNIQLIPLDKYNRFTFLPRGNRDLRRGRYCLLRTFKASPLMRIRGGKRDFVVGGWYERDLC